MPGPVPALLVIAASLPGYSVVTSTSNGAKSFMMRGMSEAQEEKSGGVSKRN
jgi:hypothetical protein